MLRMACLAAAALMAGASAASAAGSCGQFELKPGGVWQVSNACDQTIAVTRWDQGACKGGCTIELGPRSTQQIDPPQGRYDWTEQKR